MWHWVVKRLSGRAEPSNLETLEAAVRKRLDEMTASSSKWLVTVKRLDVRVESKSERAKELAERVKTYRRVGREPIASELDRELARLRNEIDEDTRQLEDARSAYASHIRRIDAIRSRFREKAREMQRLQDQTSVKELQLEIDALIKDAGSELQELLERANSLESALGARHDELVAKARVARDLVDVDLLDEAPE